MAQITLKGNPIHTRGDLPPVGTTAPDFKLTGGDLQDVTLDSFAGKKKILNIVPSLDTEVCALSAQRFEQEADQLSDTVVLTISRDLPMAQKRFCSAAGVSKVKPLSEMRDRRFGADYGVELVDGPLAGLLGRAVVVLDENNQVSHAELVPEIAQEPDYDAVLRAAK